MSNDLLSDGHKFANISMSDAFSRIHALLRAEQEYWLKSDNSKTVKKIASYQQALNLLETFVEEQNVNAFLLVFQKYQITIQGIRGCFYNSGPGVQQRRATAHQLFATIYMKMRGPSLISFNA